jgi:hypothetical protein
VKSERSEYISSQPVAARAAVQPRVNLWTWFGYLAISLVALLPRALDLGAFLNADEAMFWMQRSDTFLRAIRSADWAATAISTHPGVTTMWLGSAGIILRDALYESGMVRDGGFATFLALTRLPLALAHTVAIVVGYGLLRRLLRPTVAFIAALLWAADPFVIGYSRMLHVDGLAGTFATLSLLAACLYWHHDSRWRWLLLSGITAGLAILSKSPALALLPVVGLLAIAAAFRPPRIEDRGSKIHPRSSILDLRSSACWCGARWSRSRSSRSGRRCGSGRCALISRCSWASRPRAPGHMSRATSLWARISTGQARCSTRWRWRCG